LSSTPKRRLAFECLMAAWQKITNTQQGGIKDVIRNGINIAPMQQRSGENR
jgi:hypothetical protein